MTRIRSITVVPLVVGMVATLACDEIPEGRDGQGLGIGLSIGEATDASGGDADRPKQAGLSSQARGNGAGAA